MFKRTKVCSGVLLALGGALVATSATAQAQPAQTIEVTGSRIKRADSEGSLPVTVIKREDLEASGATTVAEFVRNISFSTSGNFRPQSGSSAQSFSEVSLRGLGSARTLVLVDGRRVAKAPNVGDAADMNSIPMAAVERIEILTDGASAIYGSDAIGGVINVILRKDFEGLHVSVGTTKPSIKGGDRQEMSAIMGVRSDKGRFVAGVSKTSRDIIFVRDYPWGADVGASSFSNAFYQAVDDGDGNLVANINNGGFRGNAGSCDFADKGFYVAASPATPTAPAGPPRCRYNFNLVAADEAASGAKSVFARGDVRIGSDWTAYMNVSSTNNTSFGRYAPVPDTILIEANSAGNLSTTPNERVFLAHRFAAAGNRDTSTDAHVNDIVIGAQGSLYGLDIDAGVRRTTSKYVEVGRGFIVRDAATAAINNGTYNIVNPFANSEAVLKSITTTIGRDGLWAQSDAYASATMDLFKVGSGNARLYVGAEYSKQDYKDIYDSLSEAGQVLGSAGTSAAGSRKVGALTSEMLLPFTKTLEGTLAARYEKYSDYGNDFSPKASLRYQPEKNLTFRASAGRGFRAPSLPQLYTKPAFSADSVVDERHCLADGGVDPDECDNTAFQINGLVISNPNLKSEKSTQFSVGAVWDATSDLSLKADYWNTKIENVLNAVSAQQIVDRDNGDSPLPIPAGLRILRAANGSILQITRGFTNEGVWKIAGLDLSAVYSHKYAALGNFRHELTWSEVLERDETGVDQNGKFGNPKSRAVLGSRWTYGSIEAVWNINYIGKNGDARGHAPSYVTHDLQAAWSAPAPLKGTKLVVGVINAGEKFPALVGSPFDQKPFNYSLYDMYGRQLYFRVEAKF
jgi:iron complex outermembrane receptor protein